VTESASALGAAQFTPPAASRPRLLLIDGHSMAFRAFYALPETMTTSTGQPVNAVYGFMTMLTRLLENENPTHIAVAFDISRKSFRTDRYPEYKGTRGETPPAFHGQVPLIKEVLGTLNIPALELEDYEADDILATLAAQGAAAGMEVLVCSGDRDTLQLVNDNVTVLYPIKGVSELARMTPAAVEAKYGVTPAQYPDIAALVGETSDNIPGVPGVGPKTAAKWISQYGSLVALLDNVSEIKGKVGETLRAYVDQVRMNRELNTLVTDLDLSTAVDATGRRGFDREGLHRIADTLQWGGLRDRVLALDLGSDAGAGSAGADGSTPSPVEVRLAEIAPGHLGEWLAELGTAPVAMAVEGSFTPVGADAWALALAPGGQVAYIDLTNIGPDDEAALANWLAADHLPKILHGAKGAAHALAARGLPLAGVTFDTEIAAYLSYPDSRNYSVAEFTERLLHRTLATESGNQPTFDFGALTDAAGGGAAGLALANQAVAIADLAVALQKQLEQKHSAHLMQDVELPLSAVLGEMERTGIAVDVPYLKQLEAEYAAEVNHAAQEAYQAIGTEINLGSPKQLQQVLFDQLGMPKTKKIKTGYTTDAAALAELLEKTSPDNPGYTFLTALLRHRDYQKLRQTVEGLLKAVGPDGRIHTTFQQTVAATGRLSSTEPNLQNVPIRTAAGQQIRKAFIAGPGYETLVTADYSQIEMRIMAHLSGDTGLIEAFSTGEDLHRYVGSRVFGVAPAEVTAEMRSKVKAMSYGLAYGLSAFGLSGQLGITPAEAQGLMDDYFERFGGVRDYLSSVVDEARQTGYTATVKGRRRYLPDLVSDNRQRRAVAERMALNAPIQGSAADIIKLAMLGVRRALAAAGMKSRELLQVHDELVLEAAPGEVAQCEQILREQMGAAFELSVPLDVSVGIGQNWFAAGH